MNKKQAKNTQLYHYFLWFFSLVVFKVCQLKYLLNVDKYKSNIGQQEVNRLP